ncbi:MAG TPA: glycoside hydrolase family 3 N-terminal domain-containing protein [Solirubrobacterales bacterium]|nr:glycoside hydrolase family 3 N-terminal domain-containing protein [Solirubrobacterales bacterium]
MEGRPPFDPDDELDFDFESSRRRWREQTDEHRIAGEGEDAGEGEGLEPPGEEGEGAGPETAAERPRRERRPRRGGLNISFGRRKRPARERPARAAREGEAAERAARRARLGTGEIPAVDPDTGERARLRDDPFTPAEVPVPGDRRSHRRDLPAKVRRRQAIAAGAVVVILVVLGIVVFSGGEESEPEPLPLKKLVGQSVVTKLGEGGADQKLVRRVRKGQVGGLIVDPRDEQTLQADLTSLQQAAADGDNPPLLVMIDQEGGDVKRLPNGPPELSAPQMGEDGDPDTARAEGEATGQFLEPLGVDVDLAPVLDVALPQTADTISSRSFGDDPALVADLGSAFIQGLQSQGVAATAKHFPGLGAATTNTDFSPVTIVTRQESLDAGIEPFRAAVEAGVRLVMMSSAIYPDLGPKKPAAFARPIVQGLLRDQLGFEGVIITDDLQSIAIQELSGPARAAVAAIGAGCDLLLYARGAQGSVQGFNALVGAVKEGGLDQAQIEAAYQRITSLKAQLAAG